MCIDTVLISYVWINEKLCLAIGKLEIYGALFSHMKLTPKKREEIGMKNDKFLNR